jgi:hypothetical protein
MKIRSVPIPRLTKLMLALCLLITATTAFKCNNPFPLPLPPPTFQSGIRVETKEAISGIPESDFPVGGVPNSGVMRQTLGPGTGNATDFAGPTNGNGLRDWPLARTNATWDLSVNYVPVIPRCGQKRYDGVYVPPNGMWWVWTCYFFAPPV